MRLKVARPNWKELISPPWAGSSERTKGSSSVLAATDASITSLSVPTALTFLPPKSTFAVAGGLPEALEPLETLEPLDVSGSCAGRGCPWGGALLLLLLGES